VADPLRVEYDKQDIRLILKGLKAMEKEATEQTKKLGFELAEYLVKEVRSAAKTPQETRIAETARASKSSKIGEFSFGFQRTAFSGGANTSRNIESAPPYGDGILAGVEFGSNRLANFRRRTARLGSGNEGYFIFPTLRKNQKELINRWERAFEKILKEFK
jgi:hypothetical protein